MAHPVSLVLPPPEGPRKRLTVLLRPLLVLPHALVVGVSILLVGGTAHPRKDVALSVAVAPITAETRWSQSSTLSDSTTRRDTGNGGTTESSHSQREDHERSFSWHLGGPTAGALGVAASAIALLDWFSVLLFGSVLVGAQSLKTMYLSWRARVLVYASLLRDEYPPFGEGEYPATLVIEKMPPERRRGSVFWRPIAVIPHLLVLALLAVAHVVALVACWVMLLIDADVPPALWRFLRGVVQWNLRVEAYLLLMHDEYPPFSLGLDDAPPSAQTHTTP
jgi:hypothetical protein